MADSFAQSAPITNDLKNVKLQLFIAIVNRGSASEVSALLLEHYARMQWVTMARGTSTSDIINMLGLGSTDKALVLGLVPQASAPQLLATVSRRLKMHKAGAGIAFTLPLSSVSRGALRVMQAACEENTENQSEVKDTMDKQANNTDFELVIAVINQGFSEDLMAAAKTAGATGGTVIDARRAGGDEAMKFFGISVQAEKEIVTILTPRANSHEIMKAINTECGMKTEAKGIVISLPVDAVSGLQES